MPIPNYDGRGLLPAFVGQANSHERSPYIAKMTEIVGFFATTDRRRRLLNNLIAYRTLLASGGFVEGLQFVDGSFVEDVERTSSREPGDIDIFSMLVLPSRFAQDHAAWRATGLPFWQGEIADRAKNKSRFELDTYAEVYPMRRPDEIRTIIYWYSLFSHQRSTMAWKGFVAVPLDAADDALAVGQL